MVNRQDKLRVAVLMGGISSERNVSLSTGRQILESLDRAKYEVIGVDAALLPGSSHGHLRGADREVDAVAEARDAFLGSNKLVPVEHIAGGKAGMRPDVVIIALHGKYGEDGTIQGMLDLLGVPYTGSGVLASALAMDKSMAKKVMAADGILVPESVDFTCRDSGWDRESVTSRVAALGYPVIVKPSRQGSTIGMTKVDAPSELSYAIKQAACYDDLLVVERFIEGTELTVGVLGNDEPFALPVIEIVPAKGFYDYEAKYTPGATEEIVPARISPEAAEAAQRIALAAHRSLGCRGMSRVDMIYTQTHDSRPMTHDPRPAGSPTRGLADRMFVLEVNTIPGMTPTSLLPRAGAAAGIPFSRLLDMLIEYALEEGS